MDTPLIWSYDFMWEHWIMKAYREIAYDAQPIKRTLMLFADNTGCDQLGNSSICGWTENAQIRQHRCTCWSGLLLSANCIGPFSCIICDNVISNKKCLNLLCSIQDQNTYGKCPKILYTKVSDKVAYAKSALDHSVCHSSKYLKKQLHKKQNSGKKVWIKVFKIFGHLPCLKSGQLSYLLYLPKYSDKHMLSYCAVSN